MGNFKFYETFIKDLYVIETKRYEDERGYFKETYNRDQFNSEWIWPDFVQDNESYSKKGVLRGIHYQYPHEQDKLVRAIEGRIYDVAVDLRKDSDFYGEYFGIILSDENDLQLYLPKGFAHGFLTLSDRARICYKCSDIYYSDEQKGIRWDDKTINIQWPLGDIEYVILNDRDREFPLLSDAKVML